VYLHRLLIGALKIVDTNKGLTEFQVDSISSLYQLWVAKEITKTLLSNDLKLVIESRSSKALICLQLLRMKE